MRSINTAIASLVLTLVLGASASAATFGFDVVEGSFDTNSYFVNVQSADNGAGVSFTFSNVAQDGSAMTSLYWDFGAYQAYFSNPTAIVEGAGVDYTDNQGSWFAASPGNLPGGTNVNFVADFGMNPDSHGGSIHNGIGAGQALTVTFALNSATDYDAIVSAMNNGQVVVGAHIQGLGENGEFSATGITTSNTPIPGAVWLLGSGLAGLVGLRRRNRA